LRAVSFDGELKLLTDHPKPTPGEGEALVRVKLAGICNTDLEIVRGYMGYKGVLGHEFVGMVENGPEGIEGLIGIRVTGEINLYCGECLYCRGGMPTHCPSRKVLGIMNKDGAMAEYVVLPIRNLHVLPDGVTDEEAVFVEPLAAAFEVLEQIEIMEGERVLVLGDGKLGLLIAQVVAGYTQADITLLGRNSNKLEIIKNKGIRSLLVSDGRPEGMYDIVIEATGTAEGFQQSMSLLRPRGALVLKSTVAQGAKLNLAPIVINEYTVIGSRCGPYAPAVKALEDKKIDVKSMISATYPIDDALEAFKKAREKGVMKVLLEMK
jgi:threonine dehydrogenase-like Zn-dependent dehydrogenase